MELSGILAEKKKEILDLWIERTLDSYTSSGFFKQASDRFANPVGANIREGLTELLELLLQGADQESWHGALDQVIRIRAVQEFTPAQAIAPILELKWVVKQVLSADRKARAILTELDAFDCEVDRLALAAFDLYSQCREQLYQLRIQELKSGSYVLTDAACPSALQRKSRQQTSVN